MPDRIREINTRFIEKVGIETTSNSYAKSQIIILDNKKEPYDIGITRADKFLLQKTDEVNDSIRSLEDAYVARISSGCKSDLFWRIVGITTAVELVDEGFDEPLECVYENYSLVCESLNGFGYDPVGNETESNEATSGYDPDQLYVLNQTTGPASGFTQRPLDWKGGLEPPTEEGQSYHTWMLDDEPYAEDLIDPIVSSGIGTIALASNILTFDTISNINQETPALAGINTGAIITCDRFGIWFDEKTTVVSYGTTIIGIGTTAVGPTPLSDVARRTWVQTEDFSMREVKTPESDGTFTNFFVSKGVSDINFDKLALKRTGELTDELSPEVPTRVCPMTEELVGKGVKIEYSNNGDPDKCEEWNKYLEGYPDPADPADVDAAKGTFEFNIVEAPENGPGKTWYRDGFSVRPILPNGNPASPGDFIIIEDFGKTCLTGTNPVLYANLPSCSSSANNAINDAETIKDDFEQQLANDLNNGQSEVAKLYQLTNALRAERNEINLRIWAFRIQIGRGESNVDSWDKRIKLINDPDFYDILQNPLDDTERSKFNKTKKLPNQ